MVLSNGFYYHVMGEIYTLDGCGPGETCYSLLELEHLTVEIKKKGTDLRSP